MNPGNPLKCKHCKRICKGAQGLAAHLRTHEKPRKKPHKKRKYVHRMKATPEAPEDMSRSLIINTIQTLLEALR